MRYFVALIPVARPTQSIAYAKSTSHATVAQLEGPEAVYAIKLGLQTAAQKKANAQSRLTVSAAQNKLTDDNKKSKRARDIANGDAAPDDDDESESESEGEPDKKKGKTVDDRDEGTLPPIRLLRGKMVLNPKLI